MSQVYIYRWAPIFFNMTGYEVVLRKRCVFNLNRPLIKLEQKKQKKTWW